MFKKMLLSMSMLLIAGAVFAQKPVVTAVTDVEDNPSNGMEMCRSLFNEYFLSVLATHSKVNTTDTASVQKAVAKLKIRRGVRLSAKQISGLCKELKTDALCLVKMKRENKNAIRVKVGMVTSKGKRIGMVSAVREGIGDTDAASSKLALESAKILRRNAGIKELTAAPVKK